MSKDLTSVADLLWRAANEHLYDGVDLHRDTFSCFAIATACNGDQVLLSRAMRLVAEMGVNPDSLGEFDEFRPLSELQGARYGWLMFASMYAQELGI